MKSQKKRISRQINVASLIVTLLSTEALSKDTSYTYPFEEVNLVQTPFQEQYATCRGTTVEDVHKVECAAICYDATSPLWGVKGYFSNSLNLAKILSDYCYSFLFNSSHRQNIGLCAMCFEETQFPELLQINDAVASVIYATPSIFCEYKLHHRTGDFKKFAKN